MRTDHQQQQPPWTISLHAKAKTFKLKLKATNFIPNFRLFHFSLLLNLSPLLIRVKSQPMQVSFAKKRNSLRSRVLRVLKRLRFRPIKKKSVPARFIKLPDHNQPKWHCIKGTIGVTSMIIANLALLSQLLFANDAQQLVFLCLIIFLYIIALWKKFMTTKACVLMILMNVALLRMKNNFSYLSLLRYAWKAWNWTNSSQSSYVPQEFQDIFANLIKRFI